MNLGNNLKLVRCMNAVAAGTTDTQKGTGVDMTGYDGVIFVGLFGTLTATAVTTFKAQSSDSDVDGNYADVPGATDSPVAATDNNKVAELDVYRPAHKFVRPVVVRATANAVIDGIIAILYKGKKKPAVNDATTARAIVTTISAG